jgi:redox-sensing transcriptional repressor
LGTRVGDFTIRDVNDISKTVKESEIKMAMLCVPAAAAQNVTDKLVEAGVKGILNYAPVSLSVPSNVRVQYIDPVIGLQRMAYYLDEN